jgi:hypothetical protein
MAAEFCNPASSASGTPLKLILSWAQHGNWDAGQMTELNWLTDRHGKVEAIQEDSMKKLLKEYPNELVSAVVPAHALLVLLKRTPPEGHKLLVIGTTSEARVLDEMSISAVFNVVMNVPVLDTEDTTRVLTAIEAFASDEEVHSAVALLDSEMPIKKLLMLVEMARQGAGSHGGKDKLTFERFLECMQGEPAPHCPTAPPPPHFHTRRPGGRVMRRLSSATQG